MKKRLFSPLLAAALAAAVALTAAALPAFADGGEETPITIGQSQEQQAECTCTALCTGDSVNADCPVCGAEDADLNKCKGFEAQPATLSNALPATALAAAPDYQVIYVGGVKISSTGYWTTDSDGNVTAYTSGDTPTDNYIHYDVANNTLTLHNATIKEEVPLNTSTYVAGAAIGVHNQNGAAELTITLEGTNTIAEVGKGIYVLASSTGEATLTITSESGGSLDASGSSNPGIWVQSNNGDAALFIQNAKVEATGTSYGVNVQSHESSTASLTVDGGSLTASGSPGILYDSIGSGTVPNTTALTISNSAIVDARDGGIGAGSLQNLKEVSPADDSVGIVFDGDDGTVYGNVTLQEDLTIGEGESLTLDDGASLNANGHNVIVDGGTVDDSIKNSLGNSVKYAPTITTAGLSNGTVGTEYSTTLATEGTAPITWSVTGGSLPEGLSLDASTGVISGTPTAKKTSTFTVTATNAYGSDSGNFTLTIGVQAVTGVTLNKNTTTIKVGGTETLTATVEPANATNKAVTWSSSDASIATVKDGVVTAVTPGTAKITVTTVDGNKTATCEVTVTTATVPVTGVTLDPTSLTLDVNQTATLTATITPNDATNQNVTWTSDNPSVATVSGGVVTAVAPGEATITATTQDGSGKTATCTVTVNKPVVPPQPSDPAPSQPTAAGSGTNSAAPRQQSPVVHNVSNSSAYRKGEYEFWMKVRTKIVSAGPGEVIEVNARDNDKMPNSVMQALAAKEDVTLRIRWNGGEEIVIPSAAALQEKMRMFYPLSYLAKFDFAQIPAKKVK